MEIAYHTTNISPETVKKQGLIKGDDGLTIKDIFEDTKAKLLLPKNHIYVSKKPWANNCSYIYIIDISGMKKYPDFGSLVDYGAYAEENSFWFENTSKLSGTLLNLVNAYNGDNIPYEKLTGQMTWECFETCVIEAPISINKILKIQRRDAVIDKLKENFNEVVEM